VTFFGIFLTPVFYSVVRRFSYRKILEFGGHYVPIGGFLNGHAGRGEGDFDDARSE